MAIPAQSQDAAAETQMRQRILHAAFAAFIENGYAETSTLAIARRAKVSKRDLYAHFGSKQAMLAACINSRAARMRLPPDLPVPANRATLAATLRGFAANLMRETAHPAVIATFRLAVAEAARSPELALTLERAGRDAARRALTDLLARAQAGGLIAGGDPDAMAGQFLGLLWEGLMVGLLLGVAAIPGPGETEDRAERAAAAFMRLHPAAGGAMPVSEGSARD